MTGNLLAAFALAGIAVPHLVRLDRAEPMCAALLWLNGLALRALAAIFVAIWLIFYLPATALFHALTHWCFHAVLPLLTAHLGFSGHNVGDVATLAPSFVLVASAASVGFGVVRAARSVRRLLTRDSLGTGPHDSVIVGGPDVFVGAAGLHRPRLVVSAGALVQLDDAELEAGLEHERGHIKHHHRFVLLFAQLCRALGRFVPGGRRAMRELVFHLERDADAYALRSHDRYALARAICKAALSREQHPVVAALGGGGGRLTDRVRGIIAADGGDAQPARLLRSAAAVGAVVTLALTVALPSTVVAGETRLAAAQPTGHCQD